MATFRLSKTDDQYRANLVNSLRAAYEAYENAVAEFNNEMQPLFGKVEDAIRVYNGIVADAKSFVDDRASQWRSEADDKSDRWKEGDRGSAVDEWISSWESFGDEVIDMPDVPEIETEGSDVADDLESLEPEPSV